MLAASSKWPSMLRGPAVAWTVSTCTSRTGRGTAARWMAAVISALVFGFTTSSRTTSSPS